MSLYKVNVGDLPMASDINQFADALNGANDIGQITLAAPVSAPSSAPSGTVVAGSGLGIGQYKYVVTYITGYKKTSGGAIISGGETTASPALTVTTTSGNQQVNLSNIPTSASPAVIGRRIYRTQVGGSTYYKLVDIYDNTTTTYTDTTPDSSLTTSVTPPSQNTTGTGFGQIYIGQPGNFGTMNVKYYGGHLHVENNNGYVFNDALWASYLNGNCYWNGSNWMRYDTNSPASSLYINYQKDPMFRSIGPGQNPITWNEYRIFHEGNFTTRTHVEAYLSSSQSLYNNTWNRIKFDTILVDYLNEFDVTNWWFTAQNTGIYMVSFGCRVSGLTSGVSYITLGTNQLNRSGNYYNITGTTVTGSNPSSGTTVVEFSGTQVLYLSAGTQLECRVYYQDNSQTAAFVPGQNYTWVNISRVA